MEATADEKNLNRDAKTARAYETPRIVFRGMLEAHASTCLVKGSCTTGTT